MTTARLLQWTTSARGSLVFVAVLLCLCVHLLGAAGTKSNKATNKDKTGKTRDHLNKACNQLQSGVHKETFVQKTLQELRSIYTASIKPLENVYRFTDLNKDALLDEEISATPLILFVGPWSTGKSTFINYLLGIEGKQEELYTGKEPTTTDFFVIQSGPKFRKLTGIQMVSDKDKAFASLEKYGQVFVQRLQGLEIPSPLLECVTLVDTPGIIENKQQQERGYPFSDVMQWFLQRASMIFLMFDVSKMEVGSELEVVFKQLKGYEGKLKVLLNKADTINQQELMKVYGALFWNMAPLVHSVEPPRVYVGSFWSKSDNGHSLAKLFLKEEESLMLDLHHVIENWVQDKIVYVHRHAIMVRLHALAVDSFLDTFNSKNCYFCNSDDVWSDIVYHPEKYNVFQKMLKQRDVYKNDLPHSSTYIKFFSQNSMSLFRSLSHYCPVLIGKCSLDLVTNAIRLQLPTLLQTFKEYNSQKQCSKDSCS
jgi:GTP-binding protein EngB required for normal cell division